MKFIDTTNKYTLIHSKYLKSEMTYLEDNAQTFKPINMHKLSCNVFRYADTWAYNMIVR